MRDVCCKEMFWIRREGLVEMKIEAELLFLFMWPRYGKESSLFFDISMKTEKQLKVDSSAWLLFLWIKIGHNLGTNLFLYPHHHHQHNAMNKRLRNVPVFHRL